MDTDVLIDLETGKVLTVSIFSVERNKPVRVRKTTDGRLEWKGVKNLFRERLTELIRKMNKDCHTVLCALAFEGQRFQVKTHNGCSFHQVRLVA